MPSFSNASLTALDSCDERLQALFFEVVGHFDCKILEGARGKARQNRMFGEGKSRHVWPDGNHNCPDGEPSRAVDVAPWPIEWDDHARFYAFGGYVKGVAMRMGISIRCGMDWDGDWSFKDQTFHDLGHFELKDD